MEVYGGAMEEAKKIWAKVLVEKNIFGIIYHRWNDEKQYEDWNQYESFIKDLYKGIDIVKVTRRPFGFHVNLKSGPVMKVSIKGGRIMYSIEGRK